MERSVQGQINHTIHVCLIQAEHCNACIHIVAGSSRTGVVLFLKEFEKSIVTDDSESIECSAPAVIATDIF